MGISLIVTALITLGFAIAEFIDTDEERLEKLHERTKESQEAAENAQKAYDDLLSNKSEYNTKLEELNKLIAGTKEWKEKLEEVNALALAIAGDFPELELKLENGVLTFDENQYEALVKEQATNATRAANLARTNQALEGMQEQKIKNESTAPFEWDEAYRGYNLSTVNVSSKSRGDILEQLAKDEQANASEIASRIKSEKGYVISEDIIEEFKKLYENNEQVRKFAAGMLSGNQDILAISKEAIAQVNNNLLSGLDSSVVDKEGINEISSIYAERIAEGLNEQIEAIEITNAKKARDELEKVGFDTSNMKDDKVIEQYKKLIVTDEYLNNFNDILKTLPEEVIKDVGSVLAPSLSNINFDMNRSKVIDALEDLYYSDEEIIKLFE